VFAFVSFWVGPANLVFSLVPMALSVGLLASLIHFECGEFKLLRYIAPAFIIAIDWILNGFYSIGGILIVVSALMIFLAYEEGWSKVESVLVMSLVVAGLITLMFVIIGIKDGQGMSIKEFYTNLYEQFKNEYVTYFEETYASMYEEIGAESISSEYIIFALDFLVGMVVSILFVAGFTLIGISSKIYSFVLGKLGSDKEKLDKWKFVPVPIYAYFYAIIELITMFISAEITSFTLCVSNLSMIFMPIFWYMGIIAATKLVDERKKRGMPIAFTVAGAVIIAIFFPRILSYAGVLYCIVSDKIKKIKDIDNS
jgi:hypothetical protein